MERPSKLSVVVAFAALYLIWGSTYLFIRFAIDTIPPLLMAGTRYLTAGAILFVVALAQGGERPRLVTWRSAAIIGAFLLLGGNGGVTMAEQFVDTGLAAIMVATVPIYIVILAWITGTSARPRPLVLLGLIGGFIGVALLMAPALHFDSAASRSQSLGMLILLCSSFLWSAGSIYSLRSKSAASPFVAAGQQMLCGGAFLFLGGLVTGEAKHFHPQAIMFLSLASWIYLVLIGAIVGFTAYIFLLRHCDAAKVATYAYVNPIVAVLLGTLFHGESLTTRTILAALLIVGSVATVITAQQFGSNRSSALSAALTEAD